MGRKRTGSAWEKPKGSGVWLAAITLADDSRTTERVPARKSGAPVDAAYARAYAREWQRRHDEGEWTPTPKGGALSRPAAAQTVGEWCEAWARGLTIGTVADVRYAVERFIGGDVIAAIPLRSLTAPDLVAWVERLRARESRYAGPLAPSSVKRYAGLMRQAIGHAVRLGALDRDPFDRVPLGTIPAARDKVPGARRLWRYDAAELQALVSDARIPADRRMLYALAFLTGGRISEIAALRWSDWERDALPLSRLNLARTAVYRRAAKGDGPWARVEKETKTGAVKEAPVHPALAAMLEVWWSRGWSEHQGREPVEGDLIVPTKDGRSRVAITSWKLLQSDCAAVGIRKRRLHGTRHTLIRAAREAGADREAVRGITHASASRDAFDGYDRPTWERTCRELMKLPMTSPESDSAPDSATAPRRNLLTARRNARVAMFSRRRWAERGGAGIGAREWALRGVIGAVPGDSAPDSATTGALSGEAHMYRWADLWLVADAGAEWSA